MFKWLKSAKKLFSGNASESAVVQIDDDGFMSEDIAVSIEDIIADQDDDSDESGVGKLYVLSLTEFKKALAETWEAREAKVFLLTESVLRQRIGAGNRWEQRGKEVFVMLFPTLSEIEATARSYDISEELGKKIIGERFDGSRRPRVRFAGVDPKDALNEDGTLNIRALEKAGEEGEAAGEAGSEPDNRASDQKPISSDGTEKQVSHPDDPDWKKNQFDHLDKDTDWQKQRHQGKSAADGNWEKMDQGGARRSEPDSQWTKMAAEEPAKAEPAPKKAKPKSRYNLTFTPCWDKKSQSLKIYRSTLTYAVSPTETVEGLAAYEKHQSEEQKHKIDSWVVQQTAKALLPMTTKEIDTPVFVPIHSSTLRPPYRDGFIDRLGGFNHGLRRNYLIIEILDDGHWEAKDLNALLKPLSILIKAVAFTPTSKTGFTLPACEGLGWIGVDLARLTEEDGISPEQLESLHQKVNAANANTYVFGITQRDVIKEMIEMGADLINGKALVKNTAVLRPPFKLPMERLTKS